MSSSSPIDSELQNASRSKPFGRLKVFLGYAAGVGKTFRMLDEARQLKSQGFDVVIGYFEPHGRKNTIAKAEHLEIIPRRKIGYRGTTFEEMDTSAILKRRPAVCIVDELAHTNVPGADRAKRWEDVQLLLEAGIDVFTTVNIQHLESLNDRVFEISGVRVRETNPDWVVRGPSELVNVAATTGALLNRLHRGDIYDPAKAKAAADNFFKESTLAALRELALRETARELELREQETEHQYQVAVPGLGKEKQTVRGAQAQDRILIHITDDPSTAMVIRRGKRIADFLGADCRAAVISPDSDLTRLSKEERERVERHLRFAENLQIETRVLAGDDPAETLVEFARRNGITQIILAHPRYNWLNRFVSRNFALQVINKAKDMRIVVIAAQRHRVPR